jgi:hypothetical protein
MTRGHWLVVAGTIGALVGTLFLSWYSVSVGPFSADVSAWDTGVLGKLAVIGMLLMVAGVVVVALGMESQVPVPIPQGMLVLGVFVALMAVFKWIDVHQDTALGLYLTIVSGAVAAYGAYELGGAGMAMPRTGGGTGEL